MTMWRGTRANPGALIGGAKNHRLNVSRTLAETSGETQGTAREWVPDLLSWRLDVERLVLTQGAGVTVEQEIQELKEGTEVSVVVMVGLDYFEGTARIVNVEVSSPHKGRVTANVSLDGTGALTRTMPDNVALDYMLPFGR